MKKFWMLACMAGLVFTITTASAQQQEPKKTKTEKPVKKDWDKDGKKGKDGKKDKDWKKNKEGTKKEKKTEEN